MQSQYDIPSQQISHHDEADALQSEVTCNVCDCEDIENGAGVPLSALRGSAANGSCAYCGALVLALDHFELGMSDVDVRIHRNEIHGFYWCEPFSDGQIEVFAEYTQEHVPPGILRRRIPSGDTSSDAALKWTIDWISACKFAHKRCWISSKNMPTRVIDVTALNSDGDVKLVDQTRHLGVCPYVALSYCWGKEEPIMRTTTENMKSQTDKISLSRLPRTIQDAIIFVRGLGIQFLWVDSLCILQDDDNDWRHEAARMSEVFGNAYVTLAGVHGETMSGGLFTSLPSLFQTKCICTITYLGKKVDIFARRPLHEHLSQHAWLSRKDSPLFSRAWTFQERLLSPRVIYFTKKELMWECCEDLGCECVGPPLEGAFVQTHSFSPKLRHAEWIYGGSSTINRWHQLITEYSGLHMTFEKDRLPGIAGLAKQFRRHRPDDHYLAGLWSSSLLADLLWSCHDSKNVRTMPICTWSWISVSGRKTYTISNFEDSFRHPFCLMGQVIDVKCKTVDDEEFGQVISASIKLKGQVLECTLLLDQSQQPRLKHPHDDRWSQSWKNSITVSQEYQCKLMLDSYDAETSGCDQFQNNEILHVLRIYEAGILSGHRSFGYFLYLVLRKSPSDGFFRRAGVFLISSDRSGQMGEQAYKGVEDSIITIL